MPVCKAEAKPARYNQCGYKKCPFGSGCFAR